MPLDANSVIAPIAWRKGEFRVATTAGVQKRLGLLTDHIGLRRVSRGLPKGRRPPRWTLTHLNSGHVICTLDAPEDEAFRLASIVIDAGDWSFQGLYGWKNIDPDLGRKIRELVDAYDALSMVGGNGEHEPQAREIAMARS